MQSVLLFPNVSMFARSVEVVTNGQIAWVEVIIIAWISSICMLVGYLYWHFQKGDENYTVHRGIRNSLLVLTSVGHLPEHAARFPVFINLLLDCFNPIIRNIHGHTVIKPISTILNRCCQPGHTRNFFRNGNRFGIYG